MNEEKIKDIKKYGKKARGQKELIKHLEGGRLTPKQAMLARCYDCCGFFADGKIDCCMPHCSLHPFMAYRENKKQLTSKKS